MFGGWSFLLLSREVKRQVSGKWGFPKPWGHGGYSQIIQWWIFHYEPSILGYPQPLRTPKIINPSSRRSCPRQLCVQLQSFGVWTIFLSLPQLCDTGLRADARRLPKAPPLSTGAQSEWLTSQLFFAEAAGWTAPVALFLWSGLCHALVYLRRC